MYPSDSEPIFSDTQAHEILRRAAELHETREFQWSEENLVEIAREAGIEPKEVYAAIAEIRAASANQMTHHRTWRTWAECAGFAAIGAATFLPVALFDSTRLTSIVTVGATSVLLGLDAAGEGAYRRYFTRSAGLWAGFWAAASALFAVDVETASVAMTVLPTLGGLVALSLSRLLTENTAASGGSQIARFARRAVQRVRSLTIRGRKLHKDRSNIERSAVPTNAPSIVCELHA